MQRMLRASGAFERSLDMLMALFDFFRGRHYLEFPLIAKNS